MATNKHAVIRYQALDKCFRNVSKKYFIEDLMKACSAAIYEYSGSDIDISRRQVFEDIKFMESVQGWSIELNRIKDGRKVLYRYIDTSFSINNTLLNEAEETQLKEVLLTLSRFKGMPQFGWIDEMLVRLESSLKLNTSPEQIIQFEQNEYLKGLEYFAEIFHAILNKRILKITYRGFKQLESSAYNFSPHFLKQYNNRWFLFGRIDSETKITNFAIDRVLEINDCSAKFIESELVFDSYFEDAIGVSVPDSTEPEKILIKVSDKLWPYVESKPLHGSQKIKEKGSNYVAIELQLHINYELISLLFSMGEGLTILQPIALADAIKNKAEKLLLNYI